MTNPKLWKVRDCGASNLEIVDQDGWQIAVLFCDYSDQEHVRQQKRHAFTMSVAREMAGTIYKLVDYIKALEDSGVSTGLTQHEIPYMESLLKRIAQADA